MKEEFHGAAGMMLHSLTTLPFWLMVGGIATAWYFYILKPDLPPVVKSRFGLFAKILENKYGFDAFNDFFFAGGARTLGRGLWKAGDVWLIDGLFVNGTAKLVGLASIMIRQIQTGYIYHYAFAMIIGIFLLISMFVR
jgi:NADH-quinone oxidoreductase subunit L